jgi:hypothetical protein
LKTIRSIPLKLKNPSLSIRSRSKDNSDDQESCRQGFSLPVALGSPGRGLFKTAGFKKLNAERAAAGEEPLPTSMLLPARSNNSTCARLVASARCGHLWLRVIRARASSRN